MTGSDPWFHPGHQRGTAASPAAPEPTPMTEAEAIAYLTPERDEAGFLRHRAADRRRGELGATEPTAADYERFGMPNIPDWSPRDPDPHRAPSRVGQRRVCRIARRAPQPRSHVPRATRRLVSFAYLAAELEAKQQERARGGERCETPGCYRPATWTITTVRDCTDVGMVEPAVAGPDYDADVHYACDTHCTAVDAFGWQPEARDTHQLYWEVRQIPESPPPRPPERPVHAEDVWDLYQHLCAIIATSERIPVKPLFDMASNLLNLYVESQPPHVAPMPGYIGSAPYEQPTRPKRISERFTELTGLPDFWEYANKVGFSAQHPPD